MDSKDARQHVRVQRGFETPGIADRCVFPYHPTIAIVEFVCHGANNGQSCGFCELYSIDVNRPNHHADSDRGITYGLQSPQGRRGAICEHFGWTYEYLLHGVAWAQVQRMMVDAPGYDPDGKKQRHIKLSQDNAQSIANYVNNLIRT